MGQDIDHATPVEAGAAGVGPWLAVGVDGSPEAVSAARFAAHQADLAEASLLLVHAYHGPAPAEPGRQVMARAEAGEDLLNDARSRMVLAPVHGVHLRLVQGSVLAVLSQVARESQLLVLGHQPVLLGAVPPPGSLVSRLASHAPCPLATVPRDWSIRHDQRPVVVAVDGRSPASALLGYGFAQAHRAGADLVLVHAAPTHGGRAEKVDLSVVGDTVERLCGDYPDVGVRRMQVTQEPEEMVVDMSRLASQVVVGHPHEESWLPSWHRSVARKVIEASQCPLVVVPAAADIARRRPRDRVGGTV